MLRASCVVLFLKLIILCLSCERVLLKSKQEPALLIVSFDGFRPDYLYRGITPNLNKVRREGTSARYMIPVFPTKTFVNHFTMATGLYPGHHGVLANSLYDTKLGLLRYSYEMFHYNEETLPIWTANELAGKHSGCLWPGSDYEYRNISCTFGNSFNESVPFENRVNNIMSWFTHERTPANLVLFYVEEPDGQSHKYGPDSIHVNKAIARVDSLTGYIEGKLIENKLQNRVNVIYVSDHGMVGIPASKFIDLTQFVEKGTCDFYGTTPILQVVPTDETKENEIFINLTKGAEQNGHFNVYNQHNLPARWHAYNLRRTGPILVLANIGYGFQDMVHTAKMYEEKFGIPYTNDSVYGDHGYDNKEPLMRANFMAKGPLFPKGKQIRPIQMINLYNLFCIILHIEKFCGKSDGFNNHNIWNELFATSRN